MTTHIRIPDVSPVAQATADGAKSVFSFPFPIFTAGDLEVRANSTLVTAGYTVVGEGSSTGGAVIFADAPANGVRVTLRRRQAYARTDDFLNERAPTPHELNDAVDRNVAALQELAEELSRAVRRPLSADLAQPVDLSLPVPEAGKPSLGTAAGHAHTGYATAAQGTKADNALLRDNRLSEFDTPTLKSEARVNLGLGNAATKDVGTNAGQVVMMEAGAKLPAIDGSQLTNLNAGALATGTVSSARLGSGTADSSSFLRGDGTWAPLSGTGASSLVATVSVSNSAALDIPQCFTAEYDAYLVEVDFLPTDDDVNLQVQFGTGGTPTWQTSSYNYADFGIFHGGSIADGATNQAAISVPGPNASWNGGRCGNATTLGVTGLLRMVGPLSPSRFKMIQGDLTLISRDNYNLSVYRHMLAGSWLGTTPVSSLRFKFSSGNIVSGTVRVYGSHKS